jgi:hypothetical protein
MQEEVYLDPLLVHAQSVAERGLKGGRPKRCHKGNVEGIRAVELPAEGVLQYGRQGGQDGITHASWANGNTATFITIGGSAQRLFIRLFGHLSLVPACRD